MNTFDIIKLLSSFYSYYQKNKDFFSKEKPPVSQPESSQAKTDAHFSNENTPSQQNAGFFDTSFLKNLFPFLNKPKGANLSEINALRKTQNQSTTTQQNLNPPNPLKKELYNTMTNHELIKERVMKKANKSNPQIKR